MLHPTVRKTVIGSGLFWLAILLFMIVQSSLNVAVAGVKPEATRLTLMMTLPFTAGASVAIIGITDWTKKIRGTKYHRSPILENIGTITIDPVTLLPGLFCLYK